MNIEFVNQYLSNIKWYNNQYWQVEGIIKGRSNEQLKFDIRYLKDFPEDKKGKLVNSKSPADKVLFENEKEWILIDAQGLIDYMKKLKLKEVKLQDLVSKLEWNIILPKKESVRSRDTVLLNNSIDPGSIM